MEKIRIDQVVGELNIDPDIGRLKLKLRERGLKATLKLEKKQADQFWVMLKLYINGTKLVDSVFIRCWFFKSGKEYHEQHPTIDLDTLEEIADKIIIELVKHLN